MKKILLISSVLISSILSFNFAFAQAPVGVVVADVNIYNAKIVSQNDRSFSISFDILNKSGAQPQIKYAVKLTKTIEKKEILVDEKIYDESISLEQNGSISRTVAYEVPAPLTAGAYSIWIMSENQSGMPLGIAFVGKVKIEKSVSNTAEIVPNSCSLEVSGGTTTRKYSVEIGAVLKEGESLSIKCKINSLFSSDVSVSPKFETRIGSDFGNTLEANSASNQAIILHTGLNSLTISLPTVSKPQIYSLSFYLQTKDGRTVSNTVMTRYFVSGKIGTIINALFDNTFYTKGETTDIKLFLAANTASSITASLSDGNGSSCADNIQMEVPNPPIINLKFPVTNKCLNPKLNVVLSATNNGQSLTLDSKEFQVMTPENLIPKEELQKTNYTNALLAVIAAIMVVLLTIFITRKKKNKEPEIPMFLKSFIFIFLGVSVFLGFGKTASAYTYMTYFNLSCGDLFGGASITNDPLYFTTNLDKTSYLPGSNMVVSEYNDDYLWPYDQGACGYSGLESFGSVYNTPLIQTLYKDIRVWKVTNFTAPTTPAPYTFDSTYNYLDASNFTNYLGLGIIPFIVPAMPTVTISAASTTIPSNSSTIISWSSTDANSCTVDKIVNNVDSLWKAQNINYKFSGSFSAGPLSIDNSNSNLSAVDFTNGMIKKFDYLGNLLSQFSYGGGTPTGLAVFASSTYVSFPAVSSSAGNCIKKFNPDGSFNSYMGSSTSQFNQVDCTGTGNGQFNKPSSIVVDASNNKYILDTGNNRVQVFGSNDKYSYQFPVINFGTASISLSSSSIAYNSSTTVSWNSSSVSTCSVMKDGSVFSNTTSGSASFSLLKTNTAFSISCSGSGGTPFAGAVVQVASYKSATSSPTANITASKVTLSNNSSTTISWSATNADTCTVTRPGTPSQPQASYWSASQNMWVSNTVSSGLSNSGVDSGLLTASGNSPIKYNFSISCTKNSTFNPPQPQQNVANNISVIVISDSTGGPGMNISPKPFAMAFDPAGYLYVNYYNSTQNNVKFTLSGTPVYSLSLTMGGSTFRTFYPIPGAVDSTGNIYASDNFDSFHYPAIGVFNPGGALQSSIPVEDPRYLSINSALKTLYFDGTDNNSLTWKLLDPSVSTTSDVITSTTKFAISCTGDGGTATSSVTVNSGQPILSMGAAPGSLYSGATTTLTWTVDNASSYTITSVPSGVYSTGETGLTGPVSKNKNNISINSQTVFTLFATGPGGTSSTSTTVSIKPTWDGGCTNCSAGNGVSSSISNSCSGAVVSLNLDPHNAGNINVYRDNSLIANLPGTSTFFQETLPYNNTYNYSLVGINGAYSATTSISVNTSGAASSSCPGVGGTVVISCTAMQAGATSPILINKSMTWTASSASSSVSKIFWTGTNIPAGGVWGTPLNLNKVYTTIGIKTVHAIPYKSDGTVLNGFCDATTTITSAGGIGGEI